MRSFGSKLLVCVGMCLLACDEPPPPEATEPLISRVELAAGNVWHRAGKERTRLITGAMLEDAAALQIDEGGRALIRLDNGAGIFFRDNTAARIAEGAVTLEKGELFADVPAGEDEMGRFKAGNVTVSASDAGLDIQYDGQRAVVYVARGLAVVTAPGGRAEVQSGEQVRVDGKGPLEVEPVSFWEDWTGGMADRESSAGIGGQGSGRIYGIDRGNPGAPPKTLQITAQNVRIGIQDGVAHTVVDQTFFNPTSTPVEGWYWFTIPEGASVERFALEVNGALVEGEMVERKQAAAAYEAAVQRAFDPALLEWIDGRTFRARIFPIPAAGERRVVLSYFELLPLSEGVYRYTYPMASAGDVIIQEFSLNVDLGEKSDAYTVRTLQDAKIEADNRHISMRRSGFQPKADFLLELAPKAETVAPLRVMRFSATSDEADYVMVRLAPEVAFDALDKVPGEVVVIMDTSAGGDDADRQVRAGAVEAILRALSKGDRFAVVATDLAPRVVFPEKGLAEATEENVSLAVERLAEIPSAGATDLGEMFSAALNLLHDATQPAVVYVGDGRATVGETSSQALANRLRRALGDARARLFTIAVGADADSGLLDRLARIGGGKSFTIGRPEQTVQEALHFVGMLKTPTITDLTIDVGKGLDQVFTSEAGKLSKGDELILVARTHHALPEEIAVSGRLGGKPFETRYTPKVETGEAFGYLPLIWARQYLTQLMGDGIVENRGRIISLGLDYAMMTPYSSFLVLESDQAYEEQGIRRRHRYRFSMRDSDKGVALAAKDVGVSIPLGLFGCSAEQEAAPPSSVEVVSEDRTEAKKAEAPATIAKAPADAPAGAPEPAAPAEEAAALDDLVADLGASASSGRGGGGSMELQKSRPRYAPKGGTLGTGYGGKRTSRARKVKETAPAIPRIAAPTISNERDETETAARDIFEKGICSDASSRSLGQRRILWSQRIDRTDDPNRLKEIFFDAGKRCELPRWRDRKAMLDLIEQTLRSPEQVQGLLAGFTGYPGIGRYLRKRILRRALDPDMTMGLYFPSSPDWRAVGTGLAAIADPDERLASLKEIIAKHPDDPEGRAMLVALLAEMGRRDEAMREAERLKRDALATPAVLEVLCDLEAAAGQVQAAKRTCSELVEFNAADPSARKRLGDIFLRHGWYDAAYRQYTSLVSLGGDDPIALLRLAAAAAGMGKIDEALRLERKVASGDGEPGPGDPRRFARLHSAVRLAQMLKAEREANHAAKAKAIERSLKQTQVFNVPSTMVFLVWEDLQMPLTLLATLGADPFAVSEKVSAAETGLMMLDLGRAPQHMPKLRVEPAGQPLARAVPFTLLTVTFDGKTFTIEEQEQTKKPIPEAA